MKKLLFLLPLVAGASWAGTTYYSGAQTQPAYNRLLEQLNGIDFLTVQSEEYNSGFINSTAITQVQVNGRNAGDDPEGVFYLHHEIKHSPVSMVPATARFGAAKIVTTLMIDRIEKQADKELLRAFDTGTPFVLNTDVEIDGETKNALKINSIEYAKQSVQLKMESGLINMLTKPNGLYEGNAKLGSFNMVDSSDGAAINLNGVGTEYSFQQVDELIFDILVDFKADGLLFNHGSGMGEGQVDEIAFGYSVKMTGDNPEVRSNSNITGISHPLVSVKSIKQNLLIDGFSTKEMIANSAEIRAAMKADSVGMEPSDEFIKNVLVKTFQPGTNISADTNVVTTDGELDAKVNIGLATDMPNLETMQTVGELARAVVANANIKADTDAVMNSPLGPMLSGSPVMNYLVMTDEHITLDAKLQNLKLDVNGETIPLELMIGHMLDAPLDSIF